MATLQELKAIKEQKYEVYVNSNVEYNETLNGVKNNVKDIMRDMYGYKPTDVSVDYSIWSEHLRIDMDRYTDNSIQFTVKTDSVNVNFDTITKSTSEDYLMMMSSVTLDYVNGKGVFSILKSVNDTLIELKEKRRKADQELTEAKIAYDVMAKERKSEMFYSIVKGGDIVKAGNNLYWTITKITEKCVYAILVDYNDVKSKRYTKEQFFNDTSKYVDLSESEA
jgi:hypothetical protein